MPEKYCVKCGTRKNLKKYAIAYFRISENSNPNVAKATDCYVYKDCERLSSRLIKKTLLIHLWTKQSGKSWTG